MFKPWVFVVLHMDPNILGGYGTRVSSSGFYIMKATMAESFRSPIVPQLPIRARLWLSVGTLPSTSITLP